MIFRRKGIDVSRYLTLFVVCIICSFGGFAQNISNEGTDFWVCFPSHVPSFDKEDNPRLANISVFITAKSNSSGIVTCGTFSKTFSVVANKVTEIQVPRNQAYIESGNPYSVNKGINIKVDQGKPKVVAYAHIFAGARSAASLVLPVEALGQKYYAISYTQDLTRQIIEKDTVHIYSQFNIVAVEDDTKVLITPVLNKIKQKSEVITLNKKGDVYSYQNSKDITGSVIEVDPSNPCKKIAVFSGSGALSIANTGCNPGNNNSADPLFQQLYPVDSWGKTFALVPFYNRLAGSIYRLLASEDNTEIEYNGSKTIAKAGDYIQVNATYDVGIVKSNKPIMVAQYALTQYCADLRNQAGNSTNVIPSDPDMVILNPLEYSIDQITLYSSTKEDIREQYINVTIPSEKVGSFKLNNVDMSGSFNIIPGYNSYSYAQIALHQIGGTNFSLSADTGFTAIAYGFGNVESYTYSAGTSLAATKIINALRAGTDVVAREGCINGAYDFKLILPYQAQSISWLLSASDPEIVVSSPVAKSISINGKVLYEHKLSVGKIFGSPGVKSIVVKALPPPSANVCQLNEAETINFDFDVVDLPLANFKAPQAVCVGKEVSFSYQEQHIGRSINSWLWDFGDGTTSTEINPKHVFTKAGQFSVSLILGSTAGCISDPYVAVINVYEQQEPLWQTAPFLCINEGVQFEDKTVYSSQDKVTWLWDFGDQQSSTQQHPVHQYTKGGNYEVTLLVTNQYGCSNSSKKTIFINDPASVSFENERSCTSDIVTFSAKALSGQVSSWEWDFGDSSNDLSQKFKMVAQHQYAQPGTYQVVLKALSREGCLTVLKKDVIISGDSPQPKFEIATSAICGDDKLIVTNQSTNQEGIISKLEWFFDYGGNTSFTLIDANPEINKVYEFKYPSLPQDKEYQVVLRAYSGVSCYRETAPIKIKVYGEPALSFKLDKQICINAEPFKLDAENKTIAILGQEKFDGNGVAAGVFDPAKAGLGRHELVYTFLSVSGCTDTLKRYIEVVAKPELVEEKAFDILLGGEKQLDLKLDVSENISYQWYPSTGLSADNILNPIVSPETSTKYILILSNEVGCVNSYEVPVNVHMDPDIPNAFSPNGDGINDKWNIKYLDTFVNADIRIFNRYGQEVFYSKRYTDAWDGKMKGQDLPVGVYYYIIEPHNGRAKYSGSLTLLR